jgi:hypothetical protein
MSFISGIDYFRISSLDMFVAVREVFGDAPLCITTGSNACPPSLR